MYYHGWAGRNLFNELARKVFRSEFADCRATSGVVANLAIYAAFSRPGDYMIATSIPNGGHISHGKSGIFEMFVQELPQNKSHLIEQIIQYLPRLEFNDTQLHFL